ncbi:MAG: hypothetical protein ABIV48_05285 [Pyrinomonadaceae bacterium]
MKNKFMPVAIVTILGLFMLVGSTQHFVFGQELENKSKESTEHSSNSKGVVGTWQTVIIPRNCQSGVPVAPAFPGLLTFSNGGTLTGTNTAVSSAFGIWQFERGPRQYSFAFISLRSSPTGAFIGTQKVRQTVALEAGGDDFTATGSVEFLDADGITIGTGCSSVIGVRFE